MHVTKQTTSMYLMLSAVLMFFSIFSYIQYQVFHSPSPSSDSVRFTIGLISTMFMGYFAVCISYISARSLNLIQCVIFLWGSIMYLTIIIYGFALLYVTRGICEGQEVVHDPYKSIYFSIITWTTVGYGDFTPSPETRFYAAVEALLGYIFMATFIGTFISFSNRLQLTKHD